MVLLFNFLKLMLFSTVHGIVIEFGKETSSLERVCSPFLQSLKSTVFFSERRAELYSLYSSIPLSKDTWRFENYLNVHKYNNILFDGKILEFDSLGWLNGNQTIYHKLPYFISNPAFRIPHISKELCDSNGFFNIGFRIFQV